MKLYFKQTTILMGMCSTLGMYAPEVQASNGEANSLIATSVQQTKKVTGNISDSMGPLIGATIKEKGTGNGVVTDLDGNFSRLFANFGAHNAQLQNSLRKFYIKC